MARPRVIVYEVASVDGRLTIAPDLAPGETPTGLRLLYHAGLPNGHVRLHYEVVRA